MRVAYFDTTSDAYFYQVHTEGEQRGGKAVLIKLVGRSSNKEIDVYSCAGSNITEANVTCSCDRLVIGSS